MARGDVVSGISSVPALAHLHFQPPAGVEVMITEVGSDLWAGTTPNKTPLASVCLIDGAGLSSKARRTHEVTYWSGGTLKLFVTNHLFLAVRNENSAISAHIFYCGIQTK